MRMTDLYGLFIKKLLLRIVRPLLRKIFAFNIILVYKANTEKLIKR